MLRAMNASRTMPVRPDGNRALHKARKMQSTAR